MRGTLNNGKTLFVSGDSSNYPRNNEHDAHKKYQLLIHSLSHQHNASNTDRHILLLQKWCRDYNDGLLVRDLEYVNQVLDITKQHLHSNEQAFLHVFKNVLNLCSKPLLESKSNERLRPKSIESIISFYKSIGSCWSDNSAVDIVKCFRCIINDGQDPHTTSNNDSKQLLSNTEAHQMIDRPLVLNLLRKSDVLNLLITKFNESITSYVKSREEYSKALGTQNQSMKDREHRNSLNEEEFISSISLEELKHKMHSCHAIVDALLEFCVDLSTDSKSASEMFLSGICNGCVTMLRDISVNAGPRNPRITELIQLLWTCLECSKSEGDQNSEYEDNVLNVGFSIEVLRDLLLLVIDEGYRLVDKECRNEIMIVLTLILTTFPEKSITQMMLSGLLDIIVTLSCVGEMTSDGWKYFYPTNLKLRNFSTPSEIDLQFKRLLWSFIVQAVMSDDSDVLLCIASSPILELMLTYLEFDPNCGIGDGPAIGVSTVSTNGSAYTTSQMSLVYLRNSYQSSTRIVIQHQPVSSNQSKIDPDTVDEYRSPNLSFNDTDLLETANSNIDNTLNTKIGLSFQSYLSALPISQLRQFQIIASNFLVWNASKLIKEFLQCNGPQRLMQIIHNLSLVKSNIANNCDLIYYCLLILCRCVISSNMVKELLTTMNALSQLIDLYRCYGLSNTLSGTNQMIGSNNDTIRMEEMNIQCVRLIGLLCSNHELCQLSFNEYGGMQLLIHSLHEYAKDKKPSIGLVSKCLTNQSRNPSNESNDYSYHDNYQTNNAAFTVATLMNNSSMGNKMTSPLNQTNPQSLTNPTSNRVSMNDMNLPIIAIIDCLRSCVIGNTKNESTFALNEGIDGLLDVLEVLPHLMRIQIYRFIAEILRNHDLLIFFRTWKSSKTMRSSAQLFCHGWLDEEVRLGCLRPDGILSNLWDPLGVQSWPTNISIDFMRESLSSNSLSEVVPLAVNRLNKAIHLSQSLNQIHQSNQNINNLTTQQISHIQHMIYQQGLTNQVYTQVLEVDARGILAAILIALDIDYSGKSFINDMKKTKQDEYDDSISVSDKDDSSIHSNEQMQKNILQNNMIEYGLSCKDRQVLGFAKQYRYFRSNEWWDSVLECPMISHIDGTQTVPIEDDINMVQGYKNEIFQSIIQVQMEQIALDQEQKMLDEEQVQAFHNHILDMKQQQIKSEWLKKNAKKKRLHSRRSSFQ